MPKHMAAVGEEIGEARGTVDHLAFEEPRAHRSHFAQPLDALDHRAARARIGDTGGKGQARPGGGTLHDQLMAEAEAVGTVIERIHLERQRRFKVHQGFGLAVYLSGKYCVKKRPRPRHCFSPN